MSLPRLVLVALVFWGVVGLLGVAWLRYRARAKELWHERTMAREERTDAIVEVAEQEVEERRRGGGR